MNTNIVTTEPEKQSKVLWIFLAFLLGVCVLLVGLTSVFGLSIWGLSSIQKQVSAHATQTQQAQDARATQTQQAQNARTTATVAAMIDERANFDFIDRFDDNRNVWSAESADDEYYRGEYGVMNGQYRWNFAEVKQGFSLRGLKSTGQLYMTDFDMYVDGQSRQDGEGLPCYGLDFRDTLVDNHHSNYVFQVCNGNEFAVFYFDGPSSEWTLLRSWKPSPMIQPSGWNTLGVIARKNHFKFLINNVVVDEMDDDRLNTGMVGVFIDVTQGTNRSISFDNFYLQVR